MSSAHWRKDQIAAREFSPFPRKAQGSNKGQAQQEKQYFCVENDGSIDGRVAWAKAGWKFMETKVLAETEWNRLHRAIPDPKGAPNFNGYIASPDGVANPVTILFGS